MKLYSHSGLGLLMAAAGFYSISLAAPPPPPPPPAPPDTGFTDIAALINSVPYASSRVVYVSSSLGNDGTGQIYSPASAELGGQPLAPTGAIAPYATLAAGWSQIRDGQADVLLLRRGDTWAESLYSDKEGASASARIIVAAYGPAATARPQVTHITPGTAGLAGNQLLAHYVCSLPPGGDLTPRGSVVRFEGVLWSAPVMAVSPLVGFAVSGGIDVVRCGFSRVRTLTYQEIKRAEMVFWDNTMWHHVGYAGGGGFEHNNYFQFNTGDIDSRRNISANSPGVGFRQRGLGTVEANLVLAGAISTFDIGTNTYYGEGAPEDRGTFLNFRYNLALHQPGGATAFYDIKNAVIEQNIFADGQYFTYWEDPSAVGNPLPLTDIMVQDNIFYDTNIVPAAGHAGNVTGPYLIRRNDFQSPGGGALLDMTSNDFSYEANNRFYSSSATSAWFAGYTGAYGDYVPSRGSNTQVTYSDPNRDLISYLNTLGASPASAAEAVDWFINGVPGQPTLAGAMANRLGAWDTRFTSTAVINYVRAGFDLGAIPS